MKRTVLSLTFLSTLLAGRVPTANAQATGPEIPVNLTTADSQSRPRLAMDGLGRFVVVWQSEAQDGSGTGIYLRRFSIAGVPLAGEVQVNTTTLGDQRAPAVSADDTGKIVVVWEGEDGSGRGVFARLFSAAGAPASAEIPVNTTTTGDQRRPAVSMDATGKFVVAWEGQDANGIGVFARRFSAAGTAQGGEIALNTFTALDQQRPVVALDADGRFFAAWESANVETGFDVYASRFEADGTRRDPAEFLVNGLKGGDQKAPAIAAALNGDFVVVWQSVFGEDADGAIVAQRFLQNGARKGSEFQVNTSTPGNQHGADVAMDANGDFVVAWAGPDAASDGIFGQRYRADGMPLGPEFPANDTTGGIQAEAAVAMNRRLQPTVDARVFALAWTSPDAALEGVNARLGGFGNSVTVLAPDGGRSWSLGSSQRIRFAHTLPGATREFKIELVVNGEPQELQAALLAGRTVGNYTHTVADPGFPGEFLGVIRVTSTVDATATDDSEPFPIEPPTITVLRPPPNVTANAATEIRWAHNLGLQSHVKVELARDGSTFLETLSADATNAWIQEGRLSWTPTGACQVPLSCRIQVTWLDDPDVYGISKNFDITPLSGVIFVNNTASGGGDGSFGLPFNTLAAAAAASGSGDKIFVYAGDGTTAGYDAGIVLKSGQKLIGEGAGLVVAGSTVVPAGNPPKLSNPFGSAVTLDADNEVAGVLLRPLGGNAALSRAGDLGSARFRKSSIELGTPGSGANGIVLDTTPAGTLTLESVTMSGTTSGTGIKITGGAATLTGNTGLALSVDQGRLIDVTQTSGGAISLTGGTLTNTNGTGVSFTFNISMLSVTLDGLAISTVGANPGLYLNTNSTLASFVFNDLDVTTAGATGLLAFNGGIVTVNPGATGSTINATGGPAVDMSGDGSFFGTFSSVSSTNSSTGGVSLNATSGRPIEFAAAGGSISGAAITPFSVVGGDGPISYGGTIAKTNSGNLASVLFRTGGQVTFSGNLTCIAPCSGLTVQNNTSGAPAITFSGASKLFNTGSGSAVNVASNSGASIAFTNGGLDITTSSGTGLNVSGGGAIEVTGAGNRVATTTGLAVFINGTTIGANGVNFDTVSVNGAETGIQIANAGAGPFWAGGGSLQNVTARGVDVTGGTGNVSYGGSISTSGGAARSAEISFRSGGNVTLSGNITDTSLGIQVDNNSGGAITFSGAKAINTGANPAVQLLNNPGSTINFTNGGLAITTTSGAGFTATGGAAGVNVSGSNNSVTTTTGTAVNITTTTIGTSGITFATVSVDGAANGILINGAGSGAFTAQGGSLQGVTTRGVDVNGGNGDVTYGGTIHANSGFAAEITARTGGKVLISGNLSGSGGIVLLNNTAGGSSIEFSGASKAISSANAVAVQMSNNPGARIDFSGGGLVLTTTIATAFSALGSGAAALQVTGSGNTITTGTGRAINIANTTIGANGLTFQSVSSNGSVSGIVLNNTGPNAGLTITGSGAADSGGVIQNTTGDGIVLTNTRAVSLNQIRISESGGHGINGNGVVGFALSNSTIQGAGNGPDEDGVRLFAVGGDVSFASTTITGSVARHVYIENSNEAISSLTVSNSTFSGNTSSGRDGFLVSVPFGSATVAEMTVTNSTFSNNTQIGLRVGLQGSSSVGKVEVSGCTFTGNTSGISLIANGTASFDFDIHDNPVFQDKRGQIFVASEGAMPHQVRGHIRNNPSITLNPNEIGVAVWVVASGGGTVLVNVENNHISSFGGGAVVVEASGGPAQAHAQIRNNTASTGAAGTAGLYLSSGNGTPGETSLLCANVVGNSMNAGVADYYLARYNPGTTTLQLQGLSPSPATPEQAQAFLAGTDAAPPASAFVESGTYLAGTCLVVPF